MRRGHVEKPRAIPAPAAPILHSPRMAPGVCPKCLKHIGRAMRGHAKTCGDPTVMAAVAPPAAVIAPQVTSQKPLIGPQPDAKDLIPDAGIEFSPRLPRLVHGALNPGKIGDIGNDRPSANPMPQVRRRPRDLPLEMRQAEAVRRMKANAGQ